MKQLLPFTLCILFVFTIDAQTCMPDLSTPDSIVVSPPPYDSTDMTGGIPDTACLNNYYETAFTFRVPRTIEISPVSATIDSIVLDPNDPNSVSGLPTGLSFKCNPPTCVFSPDKDSIGCALIFGTPTDATQLGNNRLVITTTIYSSIAKNGLEVEFPNALIPNADGEYIISLQDPNMFANCTTVSTDEAFQADFSLRANPNPFAYFSNIEIESRVNGTLKLAVFNVLGGAVHQQNIQLFEGTNNIEFDGSHLPTGLYVYALTDGKSVITRKFTIQR